MRSKHIQIPQALFHKKYSCLSNDDRIAYGLLCDRVRLSQKNGWINSENEVYIYFPVKNLASKLSVSETKVYRILKKLKSAGLLESERQYLGKPNKLYIGFPDVSEQEVSAPVQDTKPVFTEDSADSTDMTERCCSGDSTDLSKMTNRPINIDRSVLSNVQPNNTEYSNTEMRDTDINNTLDVSIYSPCSATTIPPDRRSVAEYCHERHNEIDADEFIDYYTAKGWSKMRNWQATIRQWERYKKRFDEEARNHLNDDELALNSLYEQYEKEDQENGVYPAK